MITIHYDAVHGVAISDGMVSDYVTDLIVLHSEGMDLGKGLLCTLSSSTVIDEFRLRVLRGELSHTELQFVFEDQVLVCNEFASLNVWPVGFADLQDRRLTELVRLACSKRKMNQ